MKPKTLYFCITFVWIFVSYQQTGTAQLDQTREESKAIFDSIKNQIHISPGSWRPLFNSEQIFWISPPWPSDQYIYVDFPESIWVNETPYYHIYLSHINWWVPAMFSYKLPKVRWEETEDVISYERCLGNYLDFGGEVGISGPNSVNIKLWIRNKTDKVLENIVLQTCAYLYPIKEFSLATNSNKYIHTNDSGWISIDKLCSEPDGGCIVELQSGPAHCDLPFIISSSETGEHHVAMTWFENTYSLFAANWHPCFHADPYFPDINPGETVTIHGKMVFYEGSLSEFGTYLMENYSLAYMTDQ